MQPRSLQAILAELDSTYQPQINNLRQQQSIIPQQVADDEKQLRAQEQDYYDNTIMSDARRRGIGFAGIPLGERARYGSTQFLPALARSRQQGRQQALSLEDAILGVNQKRNEQGQSIYQYERSLAEQQRQFNAQQAAANKANAGNDALAKYLQGLLNQPAATAKYVQRNDKGFNFTDATGKPISAAAYAVATGTPFRQLLQLMANAGDVGAKQALGFVGDDVTGNGTLYDPSKIGRNVNLYNNLVWGTGKEYKAPAVMPLGGRGW